MEILLQPQFWYKKIGFGVQVVFILTAVAEVEVFPKTAEYNIFNFHQSFSEIIVLDKNANTRVTGTIT